MRRPQSDQLAKDFVGFVHAFGVLRSDTTPSGQPMSVSTAHALCELATGPALSQRDLATRLGLTTSSSTSSSTRPGPSECADPDSTDTRIRLVVLMPDRVRIASHVLASRAQGSGRCGYQRGGHDNNEHKQDPLGGHRGSDRCFHCRVIRRRVECGQQDEVVVRAKP
jgi:hypothetical protein